MKLLKLAPVILVCGFLINCGPGGYESVPFDAAELNQDLDSTEGTADLASVEAVSQKTFGQLDSLMMEVEQALILLEAARGQANSPTLASINKVRDILEKVVDPAQGKVNNAADILERLKGIVDAVAIAYPNNPKVQKIKGQIQKYEGLVASVLAELKSGKSLLKIVIEQVIANIDRFISDPMVALVVKMVAQLILSKLAPGI
jgi:hypothetical protein